MVELSELIPVLSESPDELKRFETTQNHFYFHSKNRACLHLTVLQEGIVRLRYAPYGRFQKDFSYAISPDFVPKASAANWKEKETHYEIETKQLVIQVQKANLKIRFSDKKGNILNEEEAFRWQENITHGGENVFMAKKIQSGEVFLGLGDKTGKLNLRGRKFENWGTDTYAFGNQSDPIYKAIPFYIGVHQGLSYGIFFDNTFRTHFDFGYTQENITQFSAEGGEMNYYFIYNPTLTGIVEAYTELTGKPEMPPLWALGYHQCRWSYTPDTKVQEIAAELRKQAIPCDAIYLDIDYMDAYRCFTWHPTHFSNPQKLIADLSKNGFKTVVIIDPGIKVEEDYFVYMQGMDKGYFTSRADGNLMKGPVWPGYCHFPDFTNPEVRAWWCDLFETFLSTGVAGVWNDMNEPAIFYIDNFTQCERTFPDDARHDYDGNPCSHRKAHNIYGMQMTRATYEGVKKHRSGKRPFLITRATYSGGQRHSSVWTGDNYASWEHINIGNIQCQRLSVSGFSFAGTDIGGFVGDADGELYTRWLQLGVFHTLCRTHSSKDYASREPWTYGEPYTAIIRKFIELRYRWLPYHYTNFHKYSSQGSPILRPILFADSSDLQAIHQEDEFLVGDKVLVCPILKPLSVGRWVYLPKGEWFNYFTDESVQGGREVWVKTSLETIPVFIKAGTVLPHIKPMQYVGESEIEEIELHIYFKNGSEQSELYWDTGEGYEYQTGKYRLSVFDLTISPKHGSLKQHVKNDWEDSTLKYFNLFFHGFPQEIHNAQADGTDLVLTAHENGVFSVCVPASTKLVKW